MVSAQVLFIVVGVNNVKPVVSGIVTLDSATEPPCIELPSDSPPNERVRDDGGRCLGVVCESVFWNDEARPGVVPRYASDMNDLFLVRLGVKHKLVAEVGEST
jgi:hypothetical protein